MKNSFLFGVAAAALLAAVPAISLAQAQQAPAQPGVQQGGGDTEMKKKQEGKAEEPRQKAKEGKAQQVDEPRQKAKEGKAEQAEEPKLKAKDKAEQAEEPKLKAKDKAQQAEEPKLKAKDGKIEQAEEPKPKSKDGKVEQTEDPKLKAKDGKVEQADEPKLKAKDVEQVEDPKLKAKDGKIEQAEDPALRKDKGKAGSTDALKTKEETRTDDDEKGGARDRLGKVQLEEKERAKVRDTFTRQKVEKVRDVNFTISIGREVPRTVRYYPVPVDIVETVPAWRDHSYIVVEDEIVIIEPSTHEIVAVLDRGGRSGRGGRGSARLVLSDAERDIIRHRAKLAGSCDLAGIDIAIGVAIPRRTKLHSFPTLVIGNVPQLRPYRYCVVEDDVLVIDPKGLEIVLVIEG